MIRILETRSVATLVVILSGPSSLWAQAEVVRPPTPPDPSTVEPRTSPRKDPGGIVAIVGEEAITQADLDRRVRQVVAQLSGIMSANVVEREIPRLEWVTLERLIGDKLIAQQFRRLAAKSEGKMDVLAQQIDRQIERQLEITREKNPAIKTVDDLYEVVLKEDGLSRQEYRDFIQERIQVEVYLREQVLRGVDSYVSPEEARIYYRDHQDEFSTPKELSFRQIFIPHGRDDAFARKEAVDKGIQEGVPFVELASKYSQEAMGRDAGEAGRLVTKSFEDLKYWHRPIPEELRRLRKGQISKAIYTERGVYYFLLEDIIVGEPKSFEDVQDSIRRKLRGQREEAAVQEYIHDLIRRNPPVRFLTKPPGMPDDEGETGEGGKAQEAPEEAPKDAPPRPVDGG